MAVMFACNQVENKCLVQAKPQRSEKKKKEASVVRSNVRESGARNLCSITRSCEDIKHKQHSLTHTFSQTRRTILQEQGFREREREKERNKEAGLKRETNKQKQRTTDTHQIIANPLIVVLLVLIHPNLSQANGVALQDINS